MENFFYTNLKFLRNKYGWSQEELAKEVNYLIDNDKSIRDKDKDKHKIHYSTISRYEQCNREATMGNVINLSLALKVSVVDMICKDLRQQKKQVDENAKKELLKKALIEKKLIQPDSDFTEEEFEKAIELYNAFKKINDKK